MKSKTDDRFWKKVKKGDGCWLWQGASAKNGNEKGSRGIALHDGRLQYAPVISYKLTKGRVPPGRYVMHSCDNPSCVKPSHLSLGTKSENMQDCRDKGRLGGAALGKD